MADIAIRCTLRAANGVNADNCVNTFAANGATPGTDDGIITALFDQFYNDTTTGGDALAEFINDTILRTNGLVVDLIETPQTVPNAPYYTEVFDVTAVSGGGQLPQEAAVCLSFVTADYLTSPTPGRERGRVYIGPLAENAGRDGGTNDILRPSNALVTTLTEAASRLRSGMSGTGRNWAVWTRADNQFNDVDGGWVDDEFDTQRRRGRPRTARTIWT